MGADRRIFISHANADKAVAREIATALRKSGVDVWFDEHELLVGDSLANVIADAISSSDYMLVLLSPQSVASKWVQHELNAAYARDLDRRDITIIPVLIADCKIPPLLATKQILDLRHDIQRGVSLLVSQLGIAPKIDFSQLDYRGFEEMVVDLLLALGFYAIQREVRIEGRHIDIVANHDISDPFGVIQEIKWLVEVKFYRRERINLQTIHEILGLLSTLPEKYQGILVTNGQLTSAAQNFLEDEQRRRVQLRVIDGPELKRLLLKHLDVVRRYFNGDSSEEGE